MRERLLELLEKEYDALDIFALSDRLGLSTPAELQELQIVLSNLLDEHILHISTKNKYILIENCPDFRKGLIDVKEKGFGFLLLEGEPDIFIPKDEIGLALDGDTVLVKITKMDQFKPEGRVIKVLKRDINNIIGSIKSDGHSLYFEPKNPLKINLIVDESSLKGCVEGEIVAVRVHDDLGKNRYIGAVEKHICHKDDPKQDILAIAAKHDIFEEFPEDADKQASLLPTELSEDMLEEAKRTRVDLTDKMIFTIDGADTKDIDDAISLDIEDEYYILGVHIADVTNYVQEGSPMDMEALARGTSNYLADSVIPMYDHRLSNGICSLNPCVYRYAVTCEAKIDARGHVVSFDHYLSLIKSNKKMTYSAVNKILEEGEIPEGYEPYAEKLKQMMELAHIIRAERERRGASDFNVPEAKVICDESGKCVDIKKRVQGEGERMIEDFMIVANECTAKAFAFAGLPGVYRVHDVPKPEKISDFIAFCSANGKKIKGKFNNISPKVYKSMLDQLELAEGEEIIYNSLAVRTMPKAFYSEQNIGHFGLASKYYSHFTSPIRRYPDTMIHRLLKTFVIEANYDQKIMEYYENKLPEICKQCSSREVKALEAEREVVKMKFAEYMEDHVGEAFEGVIISITSFGIFVQLDNLIEGLIPIACLVDDYYEYDEVTQSLIGRHHKNVYKIGQRLEVTCTKASKALMQIDFDLTANLSKTHESHKKLSIKDRRHVRN